MNDSTGSAVSINSQKFKFQKACFLIGLTFIVIPDLTIAQDSIDPKQEYECYRGIIPEFSSDVMNGDITYYSYSIYGPKKKSEKQNTDENNTDENNGDEAEVDHKTKCASFVGTRRYHYDIERVSDKLAFWRGKKSATTAVSSKSNFAPTLAKPKDSNLEFYKEGNPITSFKDTVVRPFLRFVPELKKKTKNKKKVHPNLVMKSVVQSDDQRSTRWPFIPHEWQDKPSEKKPIFINYETGDPDDNPSTFTHHLIERPHVTSNGCWLLIPESELRHDRHTKDHESIKTFRYQNVRIYPLGKEDAKKRCEEPHFINNFEFDAKRALGKRLLDKKIVDGKTTWTIPLTGFKLLDFHPAVLDGYETDPANVKPLEYEDFKNNKLFGIDYAARSMQPNELEVFFQAGTSKGKREIDDGVDEHVKYLEGSLNYVKFTIKGEDIEATEHTLISQQRGGKNSCLRKDKDGETLWRAHWISNLSLSRDMNRLYFLAGLEEGNESSRVGLFTIGVKQNELDEVECKRMDEGLHFMGDYPLTGYSVSPNGTRLTAWFEKEGESVVRFYALNKNSDKVLYQFPETIQGIGSVFDVAEDLSASGAVTEKTYYVMHSHLDFPVSLSRCVLSDGLFSCSSRNNPLDTSSFGKEIVKNRNVSEKSGEIPFDNAIGRIPYFELRPKESNCKTIVSIHGGPHEAWNGTFSPREFTLAQLGYTVYLPNPTGSTGYTLKYAKAGEREWGTAIAEDVKFFIEKAYEKHKTSADENKCDENSRGFYLKGFSFGGYMMNWLLSTPVSKFKTKSHIDGVIAVNGIFNLRDFAETTDQAWFAQFQLGRSGSAASTANSGPLVKQNPATQFENLITFKSNPIMPPILFIAGTYDQRVNFCGNVPNMLAFYRKNQIPYALQLEKYETHVFDNLKSWKQAHLIDSWFTELKHCEDTTFRNTWNLACTAKKEMTGFSNRSVSQVFDNCLPYEFYQDCLKDVDKDEASTLIPPACGVSSTTISSM